MLNESYARDYSYYNTVDDFINECSYVENYQEFIDYYKEMMENNCCGFYYIYAILENGDTLKHKFIFLDKKYNKILLSPVEIPEENMFNTTKTIIKKQYKYEPVNISNYHTKRGYLVDFDGNIRKKEKDEETVTINYTSFLVKSEKNYDIKKYLKKGEVVYLDYFAPFNQKEIEKRHYQGFYEIRLVLKTGEHINLYYYLKKREEDKIFIEPIFEDNFLRNMHNIPEKYVKAVLYKFYPVSCRIGWKWYYLNDLEYLKHYTNHMYTSYGSGDYIAILADYMSDKVFSAIKKFGNEGKIIYTFTIKNGNSISTQREVYEFVKIKKNYQNNKKYIILKTLYLPRQCWYETELSDIESERWLYVLD